MKYVIPLAFAPSPYGEMEVEMYTSTEAKPRKMVRVTLSNNGGVSMSVVVPHKMLTEVLRGKR